MQITITNEHVRKVWDALALCPAGFALEEAFASSHYSSSVVVTCSVTLWSAIRMASVRVNSRPGMPYCRLSVRMSASNRAVVFVRQPHVQL